MKPSFLLKHVECTGMLLDLNYGILFKQSMWSGISIKNAIRSPEESGARILGRVNTISLLAQIQATDKLKVGFAYEIPTKTEQLISSSFELMI